MGDLSRELHDDNPRSSLGRAVRLWRESGQSESAFISALYDAKKVAARRGSIQKRATGEAGELGLRNKTPYFLAVLEDRLGLKTPASNS